jgi:predicted RNA-binding Zn ribbon-like protein
METGKRQPAPGQLRLIQAFVNTVDIEERREGLIGPEHLRAWLIGHELLDGSATVSEADLQRMLELREALRALLLANNGAPADSEALASLNRVAEGAALLVRFGASGQARLEPAEPGVDGAIGRILAIVLAAMIEGSWARLKACRNDTCRWAFYDTSKNHGGTWCSMAICGSRIKARAYRRRQRGDQPSPPVDQPDNLSYRGIK